MRRHLLVIPTVLVLAGCPKDEPKPDPAASAKPTSSAPAVGSATVASASASASAAGMAPAASAGARYAIDPKSTTSVDMPAPKERIKAKTDAASGVLTIDLAKLAASRGEVKIDLATFTTSTFDDKGKNESQTEHARTWLEVVVDGKTNDTMKWAVFTIQAIESPSATDASKIAAVKEGADDVRTVTLHAKGELTIHGKKAPNEVDLEAKLHYPSGAAADSKPTSIDIKTKSPMKVKLADHDVKPRDNFGKIATKAFDLLGTKVADVANVSLELRATPAP